ncbi:MAG: sigma-70 family RNA polymerase sigma factor [Saprospiraceae bacterium]
MTSDINILISKSLKGNRSSQKELYNLFSPAAFAIIKRYIKDDFEAEDILIESFIKVFENLNTFKNEGSFGGWVNKIAIRESLMYLRKNKAFNMFIEVDNIHIKEPVSSDDNILFEDLLKILDELPTGYRTVFNLYEIEGYKHHEIAELLGISTNTSKSQLRLAKDRLRKLINSKNKINTA